MANQNPTSSVKPEWKVSLRKYASIWSYFTTNPQGGGFGSSCNSGAPKRRALAAAVRGIPAGTQVEVITENEGRFVNRQLITV